MSNSCREQQFPLSGAVLAGGRSQRLGGRDKAVFEFGGETLLSRNLRLLESVCRETLISTNRRYLGFPGARQVGDLTIGQGPLGAIRSCLHSAAFPHLLIVAADMPFLNPVGLSLLWQARDEADVIIPRTVDGLQPLCALYHRNCLAGIEKQLLQGHYKIRSFFAEVRVSEIYCPEIFSEHFFLNINSPEDYDKAKSIMQIKRFEFSSATCY